MEQKLTDIRYENLTPAETDIFLTVENTRDLWERYAALMRSSLKHADWDFEKLAGSPSFFKIITDGAKACRAAGASYGPLSRESKMRIAAVLISRWED